MKKRSEHRRGAALLAVGLVLAAAGVGGGLRASRAGAVPSYGSYTLAATAPGVEVSEDEPSANAHPEGAALVPYASVALSNPGVGYALSSVAWPGATEANGTALVSLLFPHEVRPPVPGAPAVPVPDAVRQLALGAAPLVNYPVRAEAYSETQPDASYDQIPGTTLKAHADAGLAQATGQVDGADQAGVAHYGSMTSVTNASLGDTASEATATSRITDIALAGGVVKIDSITSTAHTTTDGTTASGDGSTLVDGMTIGGIDAYLDQSGLHIGSAGAPANAIANQLAKQALSQAGMEVYVTEPHSETDGATASFEAGSVLFRWTPPNNPSGNVFVIAFGGARASTTASPGFDVNAPTTSGPDIVAPPATSSPGTAPAGSVGSHPTTATAAPTTTATTAGGAAPLDTSPIAALFGGIPAGWVLAALAGVALMAAGTKRLSDEILDRPPSTCPLETT